MKIPKRFNDWDQVSAQQIRELLLAYGFTPLTKLINAEHWTLHTNRVILLWSGDKPEKAQPIGIVGAVIIQDSEDNLLLSVQ